MIGIYKITNLINGKSYVGQSIHIERRWQEHCQLASTSQISKAIKKYGKENFLFEILEQCSIEELNNQENYWIAHFDTIVPNGYNIAENTESTHTTYRYFDKECLQLIILDIKNSNLSLKDIAEKYSLTVGTISRINAGKIHIQENEIYPLRKTNWQPAEKHYCIDCGKEISMYASRCIACSAKQRVIPLDSMPITREELKELIRTKPFTHIAKKYQVTDNAIKKWCDKFNLPRTKKEIKTYSDEDWKNV